MDSSFKIWRTSYSVYDNDDAVGIKEEKEEEKREREGGEGEGERGDGK